MINLSPIYFGYIWLRFLRYKFSAWLTLVVAPLEILFSSGLQRIHVQNRFLYALVKIDFVGVYKLLNDLLV